MNTRRDSIKSLPPGFESQLELTADHLTQSQPIQSQLELTADHLAIHDMHQTIRFPQCVERLPLTPNASDGQNSWSRKTYFCKNVDSRLLKFILQAIVSLTVLGVSVSQLILGHGDTQLWSSLLSFTIGIWFPQPDLRGLSRK
jgi:hypothetical protein